MGIKQRIAKSVIKTAKDAKNYLIMDKTGPVGRATGTTAALNKAERLNQQYGGQKYYAELVQRVDYSKKTVTIGGKELRVRDRFLPAKPKK